MRRLRVSLAALSPRQLAGHQNVKSQQYISESIQIQPGWIWHILFFKFSSKCRFNLKWKFQFSHLLSFKFVCGELLVCDISVLILYEHLLEMYNTRPGPDMGLSLGAGNTILTWTLEIINIILVVKIKILLLPWSLESTVTSKNHHYTATIATTTTTTTTSTDTQLNTQAVPKLILINKCQVSGRRDFISGARQWHAVVMLTLCHIFDNGLTTSSWAAISSCVYAFIWTNLKMTWKWWSYVTIRHWPYIHHYR